MEGPWDYLLYRYANNYGNDGPGPIESGVLNLRWQILVQHTPIYAYMQIVLQRKYETVLSIGMQIWFRVLLCTGLTVLLLVWFNNRTSTGRLGAVGTGLLETFVHSTQFMLAWCLCAAAVCALPCVCAAVLKSSTRYS